MTGIKNNQTFHLIVILIFLAAGSWNILLFPSPIKNEIYPDVSVNIEFIKNSTDYPLDVIKELDLPTELILRSQKKDGIGINYSIRTVKNKFTYHFKCVVPGRYRFVVKFMDYVAEKKMEEVEYKGMLTFSRDSPDVMGKYSGYTNEFTVHSRYPVRINFLVEVRNNLKGSVYMASQYERKNMCDIYNLLFYRAQGGKK